MLWVGVSTQEEPRTQYLFSSYDKQRGVELFIHGAIHTRQAGVRSSLSPGFPFKF